MRLVLLCYLHWRECYEVGVGRGRDRGRAWVGQGKGQVQGQVGWAGSRSIRRVRPMQVNGKCIQFQIGHFSAFLA